MKLAVIGGGSSYTPELVKGFIDRVGRLDIDELWLMDIDRGRLDIVGEFVQRMVAASGGGFEVVLTTDQREAVKDASYVITQLRVGQIEARRRDEYLGRRHGLIGQETTGVGGFAKALRTIPVLLDIARDMADVAAPGALLANFTNPAGLITQALSQHAEIESVGVCNVPITASMTFIEMLEAKDGREIDPASTQLDTLGLNHLSWHRGFTVDGIDRWPEIMALTFEHLDQGDHTAWPRRLLEILQMVPNYYLQYYYQTEMKLKAQADWPPSRAEEVIEVEKDLLRQYADPALTVPPDDLMKRGGAYYSTAATQLITAHANDLGEMHVVNVAHRGAISGWPADWVLEMPCRVDASGIHPIEAAPLPPVCFGLLSAVKAFELLTVEAAVSGSRRVAYEALLAHPLGPQAERIQAVLDDIIDTNREYLPDYWER